MARLEINGFKVLLENSDHNNEEKTVVGHYWKGIDGLVTEWRARHEIPLNMYMFPTKYWQYMKQMKIMRSIPCLEVSIIKINGL